MQPDPKEPIAIPPIRLPQLRADTENLPIERVEHLQENLVRPDGDDMAGEGGSGGGGTGLPAGYTFEQFTICSNGAPATRYWPTWLVNPS